MSNISFCTPVSFGQQAQTLSQSLLEIADDYFFFGGEKAIVDFTKTIEGSFGINLVDANSSWKETALKIISYFTIILPAILFLAKCVLRLCAYHFHVITKPLDEHFLEQLVGELVKVSSLHVTAGEGLHESRADELGVINLIVDYVGTTPYFFGKEEWKKYFGADVSNDKKGILDSKEFKDFWYGPDPIDSTKKVYETHIEPVFCPNSFSINQDSFAYCINSLGDLIKEPTSGHFTAIYNYDSVVLDQHGTTSVKEACWMVMRKDVFAKHMIYSDQVNAINALNIKSGINYEKEPGLIDIATIIAVQQVMDGKTSINEDGITVKETCRMNNHVLVLFTSAKAGRPGNLGMFKMRNRLYPDVGIALVRKFYSPPQT